MDETAERVQLGDQGGRGRSDIYKTTLTEGFDSAIVSPGANGAALIEVIPPNSTCEEHQHFSFCSGESPANSSRHRYYRRFYSFG